MCDAMCGFVGSLGLMVFLSLLAGLLAWLQYCRFRSWRQRRVLHQYRSEQVRSFPQNRLSERRPRCVQIGLLRETVEILDEPASQHDDAVVRIKHSNGENVKTDYATLRELMRKADRQRHPTRLMA
jgi:hypothetical protein